jgi:hypothetical protein
MTDWYGQRQAEVDGLLAQLDAKQRQIQSEWENAARLAAERAEAERQERARWDALVDQQLAPRKAKLRRQYMEQHDGYDAGFEAYWARMRSVEADALREQQIEQTMREMRPTVWSYPPTPPHQASASAPAQQMREVGPED